MIALLLVLLAGCADAPCGAARDLRLSPSGLVVTEQEHPAGWGRTECYQCHQLSRIHKEDCVDGVVVDGSALNDDLVGQDTTACAECHGTNGVADWADLLDTADTAD